MGKVVEIDCEKSMKLETSRNVTKSKRSLHWCRSISKKYLCTFYYSISQKVITLSGRRFITVSGVLLHYRAVITLSGVFYYIIGQLLQYRAFITLSVGTEAIRYAVWSTLVRNMLGFALSISYTFSISTILLYFPGENHDSLNYSLHF